MAVTAVSQALISEVACQAPSAGGDAAGHAPLLALTCSGCASQQSSQQSTTTTPPPLHPTTGRCAQEGTHGGGETPSNVLARCLATHHLSAATKHHSMLEMLASDKYPPPPSPRSRRGRSRCSTTETITRLYRERTQQLSSAGCTLFRL